MIILDVIGSEPKKFNFKNRERERAFYSIWKSAHDAADYEKKIRIRIDDGETLVLDVMQIRRCVLQ